MTQNYTRTFIAFSFILCFFPPSSKYSSFELIPFLPNPFPVLYIFKESTPFFPSFLANQHFHLHPYLILPHLSNENAKNCFFYYCPSHERLYKLTSYFYVTFNKLLGIGYYCWESPKHWKWWHCSTPSWIWKANARNAKKPESWSSETIFIRLSFHVRRLHSTRIAPDFKT